MFKFPLMQDWKFDISAVLLKPSCAIRLSKPNFLDFLDYQIGNTVKLETFKTSKEAQNLAQALFCSKSRIMTKSLQSKTKVWSKS